MAKTSQQVVEKDTKDQFLRNLSLDHPLFCFRRKEEKSSIKVKIAKKKLEIYA